MSEVLSEQWQQIVASSISHATSMVQASWQEAAGEQCRPCLLFKPVLSRDGAQWCALYGANIHEGVAGFGDSPAKAMRAFDDEWLKSLPLNGRE